ncbi:hypothetical protein MPDQ_001603 [Monascus purpureus]|uniref:Uncharacterized protein n=1 Tax=Monascus purpureus TaxID=5098 RepID=A0A507QRB0_MONPU|nr:hypothetical protein MPDQ_001603 [Monascus purpureus]BDD56252.1 hypothetical protein MAP00_001726 [Monascus purpureus]
MTETSGPDHIPMANPATAAWDVPISSTDHSKLLKGFWPQDMDDKWELRADGPDAQGNYMLRMYRSWTGREQVALTVQQTKISRIQWIQRDEFGENDAKDFAKAICRGLLGCDLEALS